MVLIVLWAFLGRAVPGHWLVELDKANHIGVFFENVFFSIQDPPRQDIEVGGGGSDVA